MTRWLRAGWLRVWVIGLLLVVCGGLRLMAQTVTTTNEVRAMRGLGPMSAAGVVVAGERG